MKIFTICLLSSGTVIRWDAQRFMFTFRLGSIDWKSLCIGVAASLIAAFLLYVLAVSRGWIKVNLRDWRHYMSVIKRLKVAGLTNFYGSRAEFAQFWKAPNWIDYLRTAEHTVAVAAYWMAQGNEAEGIAYEIADLVRKPFERTVTIAI